MPLPFKEGQLSRWCLPLFTIVILFFFYSPIFIVAVQSFNLSKSPFHWGGFSLFWYEKLFQNREIQDALYNTLVIALGNAFLSTALGTGLALGLSRYRFPGKAYFEAMMNLPLVLPEIVLGIAFLSLFVLLKMELGKVSVIAGHVTFSVSYVTLILLARLAHFEKEYEEAASDLGATPWMTFARVTFPLLLPGIVAGFLLAFTLSFDDFLITYFTSGAASSTLPLKIFSMVRFGVSPEIHALSTFVLGVTSFLLILFWRMWRKST